MFQDLPPNIPEVRPEISSIPTGSTSILFKGRSQDINKKIKAFFIQKYGKNKFNKFIENRNVLEITIFTKGELVQGWEKLEFVLVITSVDKTNIILTLILDGRYNLGILNPRVSGHRDEELLYPFVISKGTLNEYLYKTLLVELGQALQK